MRKVILIVLFTVVCSGFSFAQKKELFKESEMTSKKITLGSIYYAFIEGYFKRVKSNEVKDDIIEIGETIFIEQLKTSMKRQKNRRRHYT